jgi:hypothetical protein
MLFLYDAFPSGKTISKFNTKNFSKFITFITGNMLKMNVNLVLDVDFQDESDTEPVTVEEFKNYAKIDVSDDDILIGEIITAARQLCEKYLNISLIERTVVATLENGLGNIHLPYGPYVDMVSIEDEDGNDIADYELFGTNFKWICTPSNCRFIASYLAGYTTLPKYFKTGIMQEALYLYQNRGDETVFENLAPASVITLKPHRRVIA